jgi:hypothetical protein
VPKLETFTLEGLTLKFNSYDHLPEHIHVLQPGGKWEIRVYFMSCNEGFLDFEYKKPPDPPAGFDGISKSERKQLLEKILQFRLELLAEWEKKVDVSEKYANS